MAITTSSQENFVSPLLLGLLRPCDWRHDTWPDVLTNTGPSPLRCTLGPVLSFAASDWFRARPIPVALVTLCGHFSKFARDP